MSNYGQPYVDSSSTNIDNTMPANNVNYNMVTGGDHITSDGQSKKKCYKKFYHNMLKNACNKNYHILYTITHLILFLFAIYLSWKCNNGFNLLSFLIAFFCPYLYIIWALATRGGCGVFEHVKTLPQMIH
jgi:hypothetical protein